MPDSYIEKVMRAKADVRVITINGYQLHGKIFYSDDEYIVLISGGVKKLVYKHAISTIEPSRFVKPQDI